MEREVETRLKQEIRYWDNRAAVLKEEEKAGKKTRVNWQNAERRAEDLTDRLQRRLAQIADERAIAAAPPVISGGLVVVPKGLLMAKAAAAGDPGVFAAPTADKKQVELAAMDAVMAAERELGNNPEDVSAQKVGYDILSFDPDTRKHRFIEVKGRADGADTVTVTRNEIITALNKPDDFILAIVSVENGFAHEPRYLKQPFATEPSFDTVHVTYALQELLVRSMAPA